MAQEKQFETQLRKYIESIGGYVIKQFGCRYTKAGLCDLTCCIKGKFVAIEVKAEKGKPSAKQLEQIELVKRSGGIAFVAYPQDFEMIQQLLADL